MNNEEEYLIPIFLINGQLDSGKTSFIKEIIEGGQFDEAENKLLITFEEGEEEYSDEFLDEHGFDYVSLSRDELTAEKLEELDEQYDPWMIVIEYNGMWAPADFGMLKKPHGWTVYQVITIMDASSFQLQWKNMQAIMAETVKTCESVIFNRCRLDMDLGSFRRSMKALNPAVDVIFEDENGEIISGVNEILPYDLKSDGVIDIEDEDFGIWFIDARERMDIYTGKIFRFRVQVLKNSQMDKSEFAATRRAMTCCEDDIVNIGFITEYDGAPELEDKDWVMLTARFKSDTHPAYNGQKGPVLEAVCVEPAGEPEQEVVSF